MEEKKYLVLGVEDRNVKDDPMVCTGLREAVKAANDMLAAQMRENGNDPDALGEIAYADGQPWRFADEGTLHAHSDLAPEYDVHILDPDDFTHRFTLFGNPGEATLEDCTYTVKHKVLEIKPKDLVKKNGGKRSLKAAIDRKINKFLNKVYEKEGTVDVINVETRTESVPKPFADSTADVELRTIVTVWYEVYKNA